MGRIDPNDPEYERKLQQSMKKIWVYGLRNVWRFSFDRLNGDMYLGDVGQNSWEEINYIPSNSQGGINFGWNVMEASSCFPEDYNCSKIKPKQSELVPESIAGQSVIKNIYRY